VLGAADPALTYSVTLGSLVTGDAFTGSVTRVAGEGVGTYAIQQGTLAAGSNYSLTFAPGALKIVYATTACLGEAGHQILQPVNADGTSVFKQGSTVPAKFRICDAAGNSIGTAGVVKAFQQISVANGVTSVVNETVDSTTPDAAFRWDSTARQWIFNMSTKSLKANSTYSWLITLDDGTTIPVQYGLR
jgi:hypothetical protein